MTQSKLGHSARQGARGRSAITRVLYTGTLHLWGPREGCSTDRGLQGELFPRQSTSRAKGKPEAASGLHLRFSPEKLRSRDGRGYLSAHSKSHLLPITIETRPTCPFSGSLTAPGAFLSFGACLPKAPVLHPRGQREGNVFSSFLGAGIGVAEPKDSHSAGGPGPAGTAARRDPSQQLASESSGRIYPSTAFAGSSDTDTIF